jgi:hypothetical protein
MELLKSLTFWTYHYLWKSGLITENTDQSAALYKCILEKQHTYMFTVNVITLAVHNNPTATTDVSRVLADTP